MCSFEQAVAHKCWLVSDCTEVKATGNDQLSAMNAEELHACMREDTCTSVNTHAHNQVGDGVFKVLSTSGDTYLGGDDFDNHTFTHSNAHICM